MHSHLQMEIEVEGQIVVFDEGHNLEDVSREAASLTVTVPQLNTVIEECNDVIAGMLHLLIILYLQRLWYTYVFRHVSTCRMAEYKMGYLKWLAILSFCGFCSIFWLKCTEYVQWPPVTLHSGMALIIGL